MEEKLGRYRKEVQPTTICSRYRGFCSRCHYTIWVNERIVYNGVAWHVDCKKAILDDTPRILDPRYEKTVGAVNKKRIKAALSG